MACSTLSATAQYIAPGAATPADTTPTKNSFEQSIQEARWELGAVYVQPWIGLRDTQIVNTSGEVGTEDQDDLTATVGAGLRAYLRSGKVYWTAHALPEYVWWQDLDQKRAFNGRYGVGAFGYFNRLTFEASRRLIEEQTFFSTELQELTTTRSEVDRLAVSVRLGSRLEAFATSRREDIENQEDENPTLALLDREDEKLSVGVRYEAPGGLSAALAFEDESIDFGVGARNLSTSGSGGRLDLALEGSTLDFQVSLASRSLDPEPGSDFRGFDEVTGNVDVLWDSSNRVSVLAYGRRSLSFALSAENSHFLTERFGARFDFEVRSVFLGLFAEIGEDDFVPLAAGSADRVDDVTVWGAELRIPIRDIVGLRLRARQTDYDSNFDIFDREINTVSVSIALDDIVRRLSLGENRRTW